MANIETFKFDKGVISKLKGLDIGKNWPIVYLIENGREIYIGQTLHAYIRAKEHLKNPDRNRLDKIHIISDSEYNLSATLDIESNLIQFTAADGNMTILNSNSGIVGHNYFDKQKYLAKFETIWQQLMDTKLVKKSLPVIKNSELFKYSPYKALTEEQLDIVKQLVKEIEVGKTNTYIVNGGPGTGKTILATYLFKFLKEQENTKNLEVGLVVPMTSLRDSIKKVFKNIKGLKASMVIGPSDVVKKKYDILIVDEAHRLKQRKNITNYKSFDDINKLLGLGPSGNELDWIIKNSRLRILFYDQNQSIRPSDIRPELFMLANAKSYDLRNQIRIGSGEDGDKYINFVESLFDGQNISPVRFDSYDFRIYDDIHKLVNDIKILDKKYGLSRMVSGYAWEWQSKNNPNQHDIEIDGLKFFWNSVNQNWVNSENAINEVGCIHTVQGYDLNYTGVIIGPEFSYDFQKKSFVVNIDNYKDMNGRRGIDDPEELQRYIVNIYKTLMTRGMHGTYLYIVDDNLRKYFSNITERRFEYA